MVILIILFFLLLYFFIRLVVWYEVRRNLKKFLSEWVEKDMLNIKPDKKVPEPEQTIKSNQEDNRFIYWHRKEDEREQLEKSMNAAIRAMEEKKEAEKPQKFQEYLDWCKANGIKPRYNGPHNIDHAY